jgi:signal peptidase complex subunit 3
MNTTLNRLNAVTALATSTLLCLVAVVALISYPTHHPTGSVDVKTLQVYVVVLPRQSSSPLTPVSALPHYRVSGRAQWHLDRRVQDYAKVVFDIDADFTKLFNWNTKQVFLSLAAEYDSNAHVSMPFFVQETISWLY